MDRLAEITFCTHQALHGDHPRCFGLRSSPRQASPFGSTPQAIAERTASGNSLPLALQESGVVFVKFGQVLATRVELLPAEYVTELSQLQQAVAPAPWLEVHEVLVSELGNELETVFAEVGHEPLADASIGQVHRARLHSGELVAVKVQRPRIIPVVEYDLDITICMASTLERSTGWGRSLGIVQMAEGFAASLREELDYEVEAMIIAELRTTQLRHPAAERVEVPRH